MTSTTCTATKDTDVHNHTCDQDALHEVRHGHHCPGCDVWWLQTANPTRSTVTAEGQGMLW